MDDFTEEIRVEDGHRILKFTTDSNMLPVCQPDTYSSFTGDSATENFLEYQAEQGKSSNYDDYDWTYDNAAVVKALGEAGAERILSDLSAEGILLSVEVIGSDSPREYNFTTDSYKATWEFDATALDEWCAENGFDPDTYVAEHHASYAGFYSFVESWIKDPTDRPGTIQWLKFAAYLRAEADTEGQFNDMCEAESEAWDNSTTIVPKSEKDAL